MSICNLDDNNNEFIKNNEEIYKIGKTKQMTLKMIKDYPKCSILLQMIVIKTKNK